MLRGSDPAKVALWRERFEGLKNSELSVKEFCVKLGVSMPSFYAWRRKLGVGSARQRNSSRSSAFQQVIVHSAPPVLTARLAGGVQIEMPFSDKKALRAVVDAWVRASRVGSGEPTPC